ncbi:MAG: type II toxin-antitoxin system VapC family toxin [Candidatus Diapherotrites archaeon]|uniref:Ribonuclease VapC n=1 Tax=Candidatus Iainarchaeum sp. TaxID=3101447 RepID=A0A8T3YPB1_9ARCH|nr:type II toxin-antitoxin system VapC family toxin [Candidatus Diapherotrites archaeon]
MSVYVDTNVFVYALSDRGERGELARKFLKKIEDGEIGASTSSVAFSELVYVVTRNFDRETAMKAGENLLALNNLNVESIGKTTCRIALEAIRQYSFKPQDALHYASMKESGIDEMISEDADFGKAKDIKKYTIAQFLAKLR